MKRAKVRKKCSVDTQKLPDAFTEIEKRRNVTVKNILVKNMI